MERDRAIDSLSFILSVPFFLTSFPLWVEAISASSR